MEKGGKSKPCFLQVFLLVFREEVTWRKHPIDTVFLKKWMGADFENASFTLKIYGILTHFSSGVFCVGPGKEDEECDSGMRGSDSQGAEASNW